MRRWRRPARLTHFLCVTLLTSVPAAVALAVTPASAAFDTELNPAPSPEALRELRQAITPHPRGSHLHRLIGLRQLRDPKLLPLFLHAQQSHDWATQVHGLLGMLELHRARDRNARDERTPSERPRLPEDLSTRLAALHPLAQEAVLANALDQRLIERSDFGTTIDIRLLDVPAHLLAMAESGRMDAALLNTWAGADADHISALASLLLLESGDPTGLSTLRSRLAIREGPYRGHFVIWILDAIRQFQLKAARSFVEDILAAHRDSIDIGFRAIRALAIIAPDRMAVPFEHLLSMRHAHAHRIRCALLLLEARGNAPKEAWNLLNDDDVTIQTMRAVSLALIGNRDPVDALVQLAELQHPLATPWLLDMLRQQPNDRAVTVLTALLDSALGDPERGDPAAALEAIGQLMRIGPQHVTARLSAAADDSPAQELLLLGMMNSTHPEVGPAVAAIRRIGLARPDALTLLLHARYAQSLAVDDARRLDLIVSGGANLSPGLRSQAGWLALRHRQQTDAALALLLPDISILPDKESAP